MDRTSGLDVKGQIKLKMDICEAGDDITLEPHINIIWTTFQSPAVFLQIYRNSEIPHVNIREREKQQISTKKAHKADY